MNRTRLLLIGLGAGLALVDTVALPSRADVSIEAVRAALGREVIGPRRAMADAHDFAAARLPRLPEVKTAEEWTTVANRLRDDALTKVVFRGEAARWRDAPRRIEWLETIEGGPGYHIKKLRFEAIPGLWVPALLYEPDGLKGKVPVHLDLNGHEAKGKAIEHKQIRCANLAKRGIIALNLEWFRMGQLNTSGFHHGLINAIDLCGTSGIALHLLAQKRGLDILLSHPNADPTRVGVTGLSGGGWQTIFVSGLDPRVTLAVPVAGYSSFFTRIDYLTDLGDSEQTPCDLATVVDYAHLTAMLAPRVALLTYNATDNCCFASPHALPPLEAAAGPIFALFGARDRLSTHVNFNPGTHNYEIDNRQAFYRIVADHWSRADFVLGPAEIPCDSEIKTPEQLAVPLPADNLDFHTIAVALSADLPRKAALPEGGPTASWQQERRLLLRRIVRPFEGDVVATPAGVEEKDGLKRTSWTLQVGGSWAVPAVELATSDRGGSAGTVLLLADQGRKEAAAAASKLVGEGKRVLAIDPFYFGESKMAEKGYLWALMMGTVGERPLGIQAGQVVSASRWARSRFGGSSLEVVAIGPRTGVVALTAAALEPEAITGVELHEPLASLKDLIRQKRDVTFAPELFCFGLLESFDIEQISALVAPRPLRTVGLSRESSGNRVRINGE